MLYNYRAQTWPLWSPSTQWNWRLSITATYSSLFKILVPCYRSLMEPTSPVSNVESSTTTSLIWASGFYSLSASAKTKCCSRGTSSRSFTIRLITKSWARKKQLTTWERNLSIIWGSMSRLMPVLRASASFALRIWEKPSLLTKLLDKRNLEFWDTSPEWGDSPKRYTSHV